MGGKSNFSPAHRRPTTNMPAVPVRPRREPVASRIRHRGRKSERHLLRGRRPRTASTSPRRGVCTKDPHLRTRLCAYSAPLSLRSTPLHSTTLHYTSRCVTLVHLTSLTSLRARAMMWKMYCVWPPTSPMHRTPEPSGSVAVVPATYTATPKQRGGKNQKQFFFFFDGTKRGHTPQP